MNRFTSNLRKKLPLVSLITLYVSLEIFYASLEQAGLPLPVWYLFSSYLLALGLSYLFSISLDQCIKHPLRRWCVNLSLAVVIIFTKIFWVGGFSGFRLYALVLIIFGAPVLYFYQFNHLNTSETYLISDFIPLTACFMGTNLLRRYWDKLVLKTQPGFLTIETFLIFGLSLTGALFLIVVGSYSRSIDRLLHLFKTPILVIALSVLIAAVIVSWHWKEPTPWNGSIRTDTRIFEKVDRVKDSPPVILISLDTLRIDLSSVPGEKNFESINLLKKDGVTFNQVISTTSWTLPSHASLFTGLLPIEHGAVKHVNSRIQTNHPTYTEMLKAYGYRTAAFTDGGFVAGKLGFGRGFDRYWEQLNDSYRDFVPGAIQWLAWSLNSLSSYKFRFSVSSAPAKSINSYPKLANNLNRAKDWLNDRKSGNPFFLFLHTYRIHDYWKLYPKCFAELREKHPGRASQLRKINRKQISKINHENLTEPVRKSFRDLYWCEAKQVDKTLMKFFTYLKAEGFYERSMIVLLSDHGEGFQLNTQALGHDNEQLDEILTRVPLIVKFPGNHYSGKETSSLISIRDIFPLLLNSRWFEFDRGIHSDQGPGLESILNGENYRDFTKGSHVIMSDRKWESNTTKFFVRGENYKVISNLENGNKKYYRVIDSSPFQRKISSGEIPANELRMIQKKLSRYRREFEQGPDPYNQSMFETSDSDRKTLEGLGYLK